MDLTIIIPDYKSPRLEEVINNALEINPKKIVISNFETELTKSIENKFKESQIIKFLNFKDRKNPGDYRNEGANQAYTKYLLFLDSDVRLNHKTKIFIKNKLKNGLDDKTIYWGIYSSYSENIFSKAALASI